KKSEYRKYKIKYTESFSDAQMIYEVVKRRIKRLKEENKEFPDILIIDGGKPQLSFAVKALKEEGIENLCVCSFAKTFDQLYFPDGRMIVCPRNKRNALKLLKLIRNEAHRFAITYHRKKRKEKIKKSILDEIEGIGREKKIMLLRYFGSPERIFSASIEEIKKVKGIGEKLATKIYEKLHKIEKI
ncbi:MAG: helix-hairpin-helix domain-containing protein, partial [candidate division WOR-3 bacterium]